MVLLGTGLERLLWDHFLPLLLLLSRSVVSDTFVTPWTVARQAPLSTGFPRQEYWVGCHFLYQGIFPTQGSSPHLLHWHVDSLPLSHQGSPSLSFITFLFQSVNPTATLVKNNF